MARKHPIQSVELSLDQAIHCPFCGGLVLPALDAELALNPCAHTLFIATNEGFEFRAPRFDENLKIVGVDNDDVDTEEVGLGVLTDQVDIRDGVKFTLNSPPPFGLSVYLGFAPLEAS